MKALPAVAAVLLAGCLTAPQDGAPPGTDPEEWYLGGSFTTERTNEDIAAVCDAGAGTSECAIMESYPEQFGFRFTSQRDCDAARDRILLVPHTIVRECVRIVPSGDPNAPTSSSPETSSPPREFDVRRFALTWDDPDTDRIPSSMEWQVVRAWTEDRVVTINTTTSGIEGGDFRFKLWFTPREPPGGALSYQDGALGTGTVDFDYTEAAFWSGRAITRVESVDPKSFVHIDAQDEEAGTLRGTFELTFVGRCGAGDFNCNDPDTARRTVLKGSFS